MEQGYVPLISSHGLHQLHVFIFFLALFHVMSSAITMTLARMKVFTWNPLVFLSYFFCGDHFPINNGVFPLSLFMGADSRMESMGK